MKSLSLRSRQFFYLRELLVVAMLFLGANVLFAIDATIDGIKYTLTSSGSDYTATVNKIEASNTASEIEIPSSVNYNSREYKVIEISSSSFSGCKSVKKVTIPPTVTKIGSYAFSSCSSLVSVSLREGLQSIDYYAFRGCVSLTQIELNEGLQSIGNNAFEGCVGLTSINLPQTLQELGRQAFKDTSIEAIEVPSTFSTLVDYGVPVRKIGVGENLNNSLTLDNGDYVCPVLTIQNYDKVALDVKLKKHFQRLNLNVKTADVTSSSASGGFFYRSYTLASTEIDTLYIGPSMRELPEYFFYSSFLGQNTWNIGQYQYAKVNVMVLDKDLSKDAQITVNAHVCWAPFTTPEEYQNICPLDNAPGASTLIVPKGYSRKYLMCKNWNRFSNIVEAEAGEFDKVLGSGYKLGDVNGDGVVDLADAVLLIDYIQHGAPDDFDIARGDLDKDGELTVADVTMIINIAKTQE